MIDFKTKGTLLYNDDGGKFAKNQNNIKILTQDCDIKVGTQKKDGVPVALTMEFSEKGTLDKDTFERKKDAPVLYAKTDYQKTPTDQLFSIARGFSNIFKTNLKRGFDEKYIALNGLERDTITKEEYQDVNYYV